MCKNRSVKFGLTKKKKRKHREGQKWMSPSWIENERSGN